MKIPSWRRQLASASVSRQHVCCGEVLQAATGEKVRLFFVLFFFSFQPNQCLPSLVLKESGSICTKSDEGILVSRILRPVNIVGKGGRGTLK